MLAIGRALMARPKMILMDEPSMGLSPLLVKEVFAIIQQINRDLGVTILLVEQNARAALSVASHGYIMEQGKVVLDGTRRRAARQRGRQGILSRRRRRPAQELQEPEELQAAEAMAVRDIIHRRSGARERNPEPRDSGFALRAPRNNATGVTNDEQPLRRPRNPRSRGSRDRICSRRLPDVLRAAMKAPAYAERLKGIDPAAVTSRAALAAPARAAQVRAPCPAQGHPALWRLRRTDARRVRAALHVARADLRTGSDTHRSLARRARAVRRGLSAWRRGAQYLQLSPHARRLHLRYVRARARLRGDPGRPRQYRRAVRADRGLSPDRL